MKALYRLVKFKFRLLVTLSLCLLAVYVAGGRYLLSQLPDYQEDLEAILSSSLHKPVTITNLEGDWSGFDPEVRIGGIEIGLDGQANIEQVTLRFGFLASLLAQELRFKSLEILETHIVAKQHEQGWRIAGFDLEMSVESDAGFDDSLVRRWLDGANISFIESHILVDSLRNKQRDWRLPSISLNYHDNEVFASGQLVHQSSLQPVMSFSVHGEGVLSNQPVDGEIYLEARSLHFLDDLLKAYSWKGLSIDELDAGGRVWADFDDFRLTEVQGDLQVRQLGWKVNEALQPALKNLATRFQWSAYSPDAQSFSFNELSWDWEGQRCASTSGHLSLRRQLEQSLRIGQLYLDQLDVECVNRLMLGSDLPEGQLFDRMDVSQPSGLLSKVLLEWQTLVLDSEAAPSVADGAVMEETLSENRVELGGANESESLSSQKAVQTSVAANEGALDIARKLSVKGDHLSHNRFRLQAELDNLSLQAYESTPSGSGINGYLYADEHGGQVWLDSDNFELGFPDLFLEPWAMKKTQGVIAWKLEGDDTEVFSDGLRLHMPDGSLVYGDFFLRLNPDEDEDYLGLALAMQDVPFSQVTRFVPFFEVDEDLYRWLGTGLVSGSVAEGIYYGYGSVEEDDSVNSFTSSLRVQANQGVLKFDSDWPPIEELDASIELQNDALWIDAQKASIHGTSLVGLNAEMPATTGDEIPVLVAGARALTEGANLRYWIAESPVAEHTGPIAEALEIEGVLEVDLSISIPMSDDDVGYDVNTHFKNNRIGHALSGLSFEQVRGVVNVSSETSVSAQGIELRVFDRPAQLAIDSVQSRNSAPLTALAATQETGLKEESEYVATKVSLSGSATAQRVLEHFELWPVYGLSGELNYEAALNLPYDGSEDAFLTVRSDQIGIARQWPSPMDKQTDNAEPMVLKATFSEGLTRLDGQITIAGESAGQRASDPAKRHELLAQLNFPDAAEAYGYLAMNMAPTELKSTRSGEGLALYAREISGNLSPWIEFVDEFSKALPESTNSEPLLRSLNLEVDQLEALGQRFSDSKLELMHHKAGWQASIEGADLAGEISLPTDVRLLSLDLDHIALSTETGQSTTGADGDEGTLAEGQSPEEVDDQIHPQDVPELSFRSDKVVLDGINYGAWTTHLKHDGEGVRFTQLTGELGGLRIAGQLNWQEREGHPSSYLELAFEGGNVEGFFKQIGKAAPLSSDRVLGNAALVWQDHPHEFGAEKVSGNVNLAMSEGFLKTPDGKTGALRLLGIFNAEALGRRLKLDFSDLYKSGIGYDSLELAAAIDNGRMRFEPPMKITGPSSSYEIKGVTDLSKQSLDLDMSVTLPVTSNVPLAALMLGAPQVGGAVWLVDKLLGEPLSSITSVDYRVRGTWDDPKVELK